MHWRGPKSLLHLQYHVLSELTGQVCPVLFSFGTSGQQQEAILLMIYFHYSRVTVAWGYPEASPLLLIYSGSHLGTIFTYMADHKGRDKGSDGISSSSLAFSSLGDYHTSVQGPSTLIICPHSNSLHSAGHWARPSDMPAASFISREEFSATLLEFMNRILFFYWSHRQHGPQSCLLNLPSWFGLWPFIWARQYWRKFRLGEPFTF